MRNEKSVQVRICIYALNLDTNYFQLVSAPPGFVKLPPELKVEDTRQRQQIKADMICRGRIKDGKYLFFTGLLPAGIPNWYFGDWYEIINRQKRNSFILFHFSSNGQEMTIHYFNHFKVYPVKRRQFIFNYLKSLN
jgi:hypothetical protein